MGQHRADSRVSRSRGPVTPATTPSPPPQGGKRAAGKRVAPKTSRRRAPQPAAPVLVERIVDQAPARDTSIGRRCAPRKSLFRGLPSAPILLGVAALAISAGGAVSAADPTLVGAGHQTSPTKLMQASALTGAGGVASSTVPGTRGPIVSRDSRRDTVADPADDELLAAAEAQLGQVVAARANADKSADKQDAFLKLNLWHLPVATYHLTARFGDYGLWSSYHTGLDFAAPSGTPIYAVANGTISSASYDGSYGNKTVETLDDGTELWYCHQTSFVVSAGETVRAGELIGYIGSTGHVTGPHLHLEVHPGGGDPVDPYTALVVHGVTP
jgi:murein DD-endopeptidase MepM/ murein hydrolase activator NlpD